MTYNRFVKPFYMSYYTEPKLLTKCPVCENELEINFCTNTIYIFGKKIMDNLCMLVG